MKNMKNKLMLSVLALAAFGSKVEAWNLSSLRIKSDKGASAAVFGAVVVSYGIYKLAFGGAKKAVPAVQEAAVSEIATEKQLDEVIQSGDSVRTEASEVVKADALQKLVNTIAVPFEATVAQVKSLRKQILALPCSKSQKGKMLAKLNRNVTFTNGMPSIQDSVRASLTIS